MFLAPTTRFSIHSVDGENSTSSDKKSRVGFSTVTHYSINTIAEVPEKYFEEER